MASILVSDLNHAWLTLVAQKDAAVPAHHMRQQRLYQTVIFHALLCSHQHRDEYVIDPVSERQGSLCIYLVHYAYGTPLLERKILLYLYQADKKYHRHILHRDLNEIESIVHRLAEFIGGDMVKEAFNRCRKGIRKGIDTLPDQFIGGLPFLFIQFSQIDIVAHNA